MFMEKWGCVGMMNFAWETLQREKHDLQKTADLIARSDETINPLVYGRDPAAVIVKLLQTGNGYFDPANTHLLVADGQVLGVVVGYPVADMALINKRAGQSFAGAIGLLALVKRTPLFLKLNRIMAGEMDQDGYYIHTLSIDSGYQGQGLGTEIIRHLSEEHSKIYLHVNTNNQGAVRFYEKVGFREKARGKTVFRGQELSEALMERIA